MSKHDTHAAHCRCPRCTPRHPAVPRLSALQRAIAVVTIGAALTCFSRLLIEHLTIWS